MASIIISPSSEGYSIYVTCQGHLRVYEAATLEAAQIRAKRLCYLLDLREDIITHGSRSVDTNISKPSRYPQLKDTNKPARRKK